MFYYDVEGHVRVAKMPYGFAKFLSIYPESQVRELTDSLNSIGFDLCGE